MYCRALRLLNVSFWKMYSPDVAAQRTRDAIALYFYNLEGILLSEEKRLKRSNFHGLLSNETFHRALLACAAESASIAYGRRDFSPFPGVLKDYELDPFDLTKVRIHRGHCFWTIGLKFRRRRTKKKGKKEKRKGHGGGKFPLRGVFFLICVCASEKDSRPLIFYLELTRSES